MAYEYSSQGSRLDFPNPFYAEHWLLACAAIIALGGGLTLLQSRHNLASGYGLTCWLPLLLGIGLALPGLRFGQRMLVQLRFFFGRNESSGLTRQNPARMKPDVVTPRKD